MSEILEDPGTFTGALYERIKSVTVLRYEIPGGFLSFCFLLTATRSSLVVFDGNLVKSD